MAPANWDGPFFISAHNPNKIYAGTNILWRSTDGGDSWENLSDLTTKVNRRELTIMGERADTSTASLDDGIPYYPTLTAIAESPLQAGMLYVGTDDGNVQISMNDGKDWTEVSDRMPGLPGSTWINTIEVSTHNAGMAYVAINNYRNDDFTNYLYKTTDFGKTWTSVVGDLPANRVVRTMREDPRNPNVLYLGTELGLFVSIDGGKRWVELKNNMPTLAFNDLVVHPRDNDLVLGTHGRGIWILDNLNAIQEMTPQVMNQQAHLFRVPTGEMINYTRAGGHTGDMIFRGENPPDGTIIDFYLKNPVAKKDIALAIYTQDGKLVKALKPDTTAGIQRVIWDFHYENLAGMPNNPYDTTSNNRRQRPGPDGPLAMPGLYVAKLTVNGQDYEQTFIIKDDPRVTIEIEDRAAWTETMFALGDLYEKVLSDMKPVKKVHWQLENIKNTSKLDEATVAEIRELDRMYDELLSRTRGLYGSVSRWMGKMTHDQMAQMRYFQEMVNQLTSRKDALLKMIPKLNKKLDKENQIEVK